MSTNICMSMRMTRMSPRRGSAGNVIVAVPENFHVDGRDMSSSTRLARTFFCSHPYSAELVNSIGMSARGVWATAALVSATHDRLAKRLKLPVEQIESVIRLVRSRLDASVIRYLRDAG